MAQKKPFALRIDEKLMKAVEKWAADEFRSTNAVGMVDPRCLKKSRQASEKKGRGLTCSLKRK